MSFDDEYFSGSCPTCGQAYLGATVAALRAALEKIAALSDSEMADGDGARDIACAALATPRGG